MKKKVGIITWHYYHNFGSVLQAYALQRTIKTIGHDVTIINYRNQKYGKVSTLKEWARYIVSKTFDVLKIRKSCFQYPFVCFRREYLTEGKLIQDEKELLPYCKRFEAVVCGSDQIWAPNVYNPVYLLKYVPDTVRKISYAASIGLNDIPLNLISNYKKYISRLSAVSVREQEGANLLWEICKIQSKVHLDPTLLIKVEDWTKIEKKPFIEIDNHYIFCYFLNAEHNYSSAVKSLRDKLNVKVYGYSLNNKDKEWLDREYDDIGPREFLWLIHHAESVVTDSYHCTIFSILYHKKFITIERFASSDKMCQNSRIRQLDNYFNLRKNIVSHSKIDELNPQRLDDCIVAKRLVKLREDSIKFLETALEDK